MQHRIEQAPGARSVSYRWWLGGREQRIDVQAAVETGEVRDGSEEEFITEHYWGYARGGGARTTEYRVEHPRWRVSLASSARLECDVASLYGNRFVESLTAAPTSAFLAEGSEVAVFTGRPLNV
jgi:hypothetical protein